MVSLMIGQCYDIIKPNIKIQYRKYHSHMYRINVKEYTIFMQKPFLHGKEQFIVYIQY